MVNIVTTFDAVAESVRSVYGMNREALLAPTRSTKPQAWARQVAMHLVHRLAPEASWSEIGRLFGRDRTTVRHACQKVAEWRGSGEDLNDRLEELENVCTAAIIRANEQLEPTELVGLADELGTRSGRD